MENIKKKLSWWLDSDTFSQLFGGIMEVIIFDNEFRKIIMGYLKDGVVATTDMVKLQELFDLITEHLPDVPETSQGLVEGLLEAIGSILEGAA